MSEPALPSENARDLDQNESTAPTDRAGLVLVKEGYYKYTDILFDWHKHMNIWQKNAIKSLLNGDAMTSPGHPLQAPGQEGCELYISTAENGHQKLLFSLKQIEYLQYYVHETGLADPRVVHELMGGKDAGWPEDFDFDAVKVEPWIPLPLNILLPKDLGKVEMIRLDSLAAIKREIKRIAGNNKIVKREAMLIRGTPTEQTRAEAEIDNETAGPGLRRGPMRRSYNRQGGGDARPDTWGEVPAGQEYKGWDNYPKQEPQPAATAEPALTPDTSVPPSPGLSTSVSESVDLSTPPSILETHEPDTPSEHFHHAQQAMMLASQGGLVAALSRQPDSAPEGDPSEDESKIGRSLFLALDTVTSEKDESVVLEIGWAALWWQPVKPEDVTGEFEEMREAGHFIIQDHLLTTRNGETKPDHRDKFAFGSSLPIKTDEVSAIVNKLLGDLSKKAGGGPTYIVMHLPTLQTADGEIASPPAQLLDLLKIGLFPNEWIVTLRPTNTQFPIYGDMSGLGQTSLINTALLNQAVKAQWLDTPESSPGPDLEVLAQALFKDTDERALKSMGNAGNGAICAIEVLITLLTEHEPNGSRVAQAEEPHAETDEAHDEVEPSPVEEQVAQGPEGLKDPIDPSADGFVEVPMHPSDESPVDESDSEDGRVGGVYFEDDSGDYVDLEPITD